MTGSPAAPHSILALLDRASSWISTLSSYLLVAMTLIVTYEVASRYFLGRPTIWAWDVNVQLMMALVLLGIAEVYRRDLHIRVDVFSSRLSPRARAWLDIVYFPVFLFIAIVIVWTGWEYFHKAFARGQHAPTILAPPLWPIKFLIPLAGVLLALQGVVKLIRDIPVALGRGRA